MLLRFSPLSEHFISTVLINITEVDSLCVVVISTVLGDLSFISPEPQNSVAGLGVIILIQLDLPHRVVMSIEKNKGEI